MQNTHKEEWSVTAAVWLNPESLNREPWLNNNELCECDNKTRISMAK